MSARLTSKSFGSLSVRVPPAAAGQRIGLMGGSFNPPHRAHVAVSEAMLKRLDLDEVWWLVSPGNPLKSHSELAPLDDRLAACRALAIHPRIKVTGFEAELRNASTVVTLSFLRRRYQDVHFVWIMGGDNLAGFHRWTAWRRIATLMPFVVADRPQWRLKALAAPAARALAKYRIPDSQITALALQSPPAWAYLTLRLSPESSSEIRAAGRLAAPVSSFAKKA
jgi:nicotinate-nucleotide adenylyltransferase